MQPGGRLYIGTSGFHYHHWKGVFYPAELPKSRWFDYYRLFCDCVEINNTFYRLPEEKTFAAWKRQAPTDFQYVLKLNKFITHHKRLLDAEEPLQTFLSRADLLQPQLSCILVQLPPRLKVNPDRLQSFLQRLPSRYRWAVEFRDAGWFCDEVYNLLRRKNAALCIHDKFLDHPWEITADWTYLRYHGNTPEGNYSHEYLAGAAQQIQRLLDDHLDTYVFFNNDWWGHAVRNALDLKEMISGRDSGRAVQPKLFG
jgi:uncharacterized protein YecE (DUF72 family)